MWPNLRRDFARVYHHIGYRGAARKTLHTLTSPGFQAVWSYRVTRWLMHRRIPLLGPILERLTEVWTGVSLPSETRVGPGLMILHFGGVVINGEALLGADCTLHHGVTIGNRVPGGGSPRLGDRVMVGAGAKGLGEITIGHDVEIGANAVVLASLPDGAVAVGMPARVVRVKTAGAPEAIGERDRRPRQP